jgi:ABC-type transport system involved in multi-copper enzyme maturation permease subunit
MEKIALGLLVVLMLLAANWALVAIAIGSFVKNQWTNALTALVFFVALIVIMVSLHPLLGLVGLLMAGVIGKELWEGQMKHLKEGRHGN